MAIDPAGSATQQPKPRTRVPVVDHALKAAALQNDRGRRAFDNAVTTTQLLGKGIDLPAFDDLCQLQTAALSRLAALQSGWIEGWMNWFKYAGQIKGANTLSKLVEMESNIIAQAAQLMGSQITSLVALQENVEVDYSHLIKQRLSEKR